MKKKKVLHKTLSNIKVDQTVWCCIYGKGVVVELTDYDKIVVKFGSKLAHFDKEGYLWIKTGNFVTKESTRQVLFMEEEQY